LAVDPKQYLWADHKHINESGDSTDEPNEIHTKGSPSDA
jgi:hypothetical protein